MQLTTALVERFKGGQMEVQNHSEGFIHRGEIATIIVDDNGCLEVTLAWCANGEGFPPGPKKWVKEERLLYKWNLKYGGVSDIGPSRPDQDSRLFLDFSVLDEVIVFYPPNGSKLDPARVEGLERAQA